MLIYEDLWKISKEGCRFNAQSMRVSRVDRRAATDEATARAAIFPQLPEPQMRQGKQNSFARIFTSR
jgi:hypothetical protein